MGGWHLEVFKMVVYIAFPVATFHFFNDSDWFLNRVIEGKREQMKFVDKAQNRKLRGIIEDLQAEQSAKALQELKDNNTSS